MTDIYAVLAALGIPFTRYDHSPVATCEEAAAAVPDPDSVQTKNLFLRDKPGRRHLLVVTTCAKAVDIKRFARDAGAGHLSFGSAERLQAHLGVAPGSVTVLALINDPAHAVELYVDADVWSREAWNCHPLVNTATLVLRREGIEAFLAHTGHVAHVVRLEERSV